MDESENKYKDVFFLDFFDCTSNVHSKNKLRKIFKSTLVSVDKIHERQMIFKALIENHKVFENFNYPLSYFNETFDFCIKTDFEKLLLKFKKRYIFNNKREKEVVKSKIKQMLLLFQKLINEYFSKIKIDTFPESYGSKLNQIRSILTIFILADFESLIREYKFQDKHASNVLAILSNLKKSGELEAFWNDFFEFEAFLSIAKSIRKHHFVFPEIVDEKFELKDFYHPNLESKITNSISLSHSMALFTGPNMSGKSTLMKAIYLNVYLAHLGIAIPASSGKIPFYEGFFTRFNQTDDISKGYSHFFKELKNLKSVLEQIKIGKRYFAVFDELFSGTDAEDGIEIFNKTLKGFLNKKGSMFLVSTHFNRKKIEIPDFANTLHVFHLESNIIKGKPTFTFKLRQGWSDLRLGKILFRQEGIEKLLE